MNSSPSPSRPLLSSPSISIDSLKTLQDSPHVSLDLEQQLKANHCPICIQNYPVTKIQTLLPCQHSFCSECLKFYIAVRINSNQILNVPCPQAGCTEIFPEEALQAVLEPIVFFRYKGYIKDKLALKGFRYHFCPDPACSRPFTPIQNQEEPIQCPCGVKICHHCENFLHEGKSCKEAIDAEFMKYTKENGLKFCMMCKTTSKYGFDKMECDVCDYPWCWDCGKYYGACHSCNNEWDPKLPSFVLNGGKSSFKARIKRIWKENSILKLLLLTLLSPILLLGMILVFPAIYFCPFHLEISGKRPTRSFCLTLAVLVSGIFLWIGIAGGWGFYFLIERLQNRRKPRWRAEMAQSSSANRDSSPSSQ